MNYELVKNDIRVCLDDECGEGWNGDYDPTDPEDDLLLRFSVDKMNDGNWEGVEDASYCTRLPNTISPEQVEKALAAIMQEVYDALCGGSSVKKTCERLSWICPSDLK